MVELGEPGPCYQKRSTAASNKGVDDPIEQGAGVEPGVEHGEQKALIEAMLEPAQLARPDLG